MTDRKIATNLTSGIQYTTIEKIDTPQMFVATDNTGKKYTVSQDAEIGDVLIFPNDSETPIWMPIDHFKVGRSL